MLDSRAERATDLLRSRTSCGTLPLLSSLHNQQKLPTFITASPCSSSIAATSSATACRTAADSSASSSYTCCWGGERGDEARHGRQGASWDSVQSCTARLIQDADFRKGPCPPTHLREAAGLRLLQPHQHRVELDLWESWGGRGR